MSWREWLVVGLSGGVATAIVVYACLPWLIQPWLRLVLSLRYRIRVEGLEHLPLTGPVLVAANHVTWIDGFVIAASAPRRGRFLINAQYVGWPIVRNLARRVGLIPVPFSGPRAIRTSITLAREALDRGEAVALFPEAQLTRTGLLGPFYRGLEVILQGRETVPVVPVYLDNLWGSLFSFSGGRFLRKRPEGWRRTIHVVYGPPIPTPVNVFNVRQALLEAGVRAYSRREPRSIRPLETVDPLRPRFNHPTLGPLTGATANFERDGIHQTGEKPDSVGHPLPGVALRVVDGDGQPLPPEESGRVEALVQGLSGWTDANARGFLDRDGFLFLIRDAPTLETDADHPSSSER
ncbi:1-acyl-sn-glycerol-3-phosphate acyltransferase [Singulisphaera rosea]